jgi:hypothetical protein
LKFTGERYLPSEDGKIRLEHYHRYAIATTLVKNKKVLDIASGEAYGSFFISQFEVKRGVSGAGDFVYFIAVCNQKGYEPMNFSPSIHFPEKLDLIKHYVSFAQWAKNQDLHVASLQKALADKDLELKKILEKNNYVYFLKNLFKKK